MEMMSNSEMFFLPLVGLGGLNIADATEDSSDPELWVDKLDVEKQIS